MYLALSTLPNVISAPSAPEIDPVHIPNIGAVTKPWLIAFVKVGIPMVANVGKARP